MSPLDVNLLMTVEELAKYLRIKPDTIYKKVKKGEMPALKLGKLLRFPKDLIDQWVIEQSQLTLKARKVLGEVNRKAKVARDVINSDVNEMIQDVKAAPLAKKQETLAKGLRGLWQDLNKTVAAPAKKTRRSGKGATAKKTATKRGRVAKKKV